LALTISCVSSKSLNGLDAAVTVAPGWGSSSRGVWRAKWAGILPWKAHRARARVSFSICRPIVPPIRVRWLLVLKMIAPRRPRCRRRPNRRVATVCRRFQETAHNSGIVPVHLANFFRPSAAQTGSLETRLVLICGSALAHGHVITLRRTGIELTRAADLLVGVGNHLVPLCHPANRAREREQHGEHGRGEADRRQDDP
jgi:hypothetical protein